MLGAVMKNLYHPLVTSPSNIALIKYMGKQEGNTPINASFSYTLDHLVSGVWLQPVDKSQDQWQGLQGAGWLNLKMSGLEQKRFLNFFQKLKNIFNLKKCYLVQSGNNFPKNAGAASSASSFSALTKAVYYQSLKEGGVQKWSVEELAHISRRGSGSSCRSFFRPWCLWDRKKIQAVSLPFYKWDHDLVQLDVKEKQVPSSTAHQRVHTSPYFQGRSVRAEKRLKKLFNALQNQNWKTACQVVWEEFEDMHQLFETSRPSFSYRNSKTKTALDFLEQFWKTHKDGPLVTMDAGAHIHLLYRSDQAFVRKQIRSRLPVFCFHKNNILS